MTSKRRGCCFLVVNTQYSDMKLPSFRQAYLENTAKALQSLFESLGFDIIEKKNVSATQLMEEARKIAQMDHSASDCLAIILLTLPGLTGDSLLCSDGTDVSLEAVEDLFVASRCPSLAGKPKILYRPGNRGASSEKGVTMTDGEGRAHHVPDHADFLVIETCPPECGTVFNKDTLVLSHVGMLTAVLERHGHDEDVLSCLTMVNNALSQARSTVGGYFTASVYSTLTKQLKFTKIQ